MERGTVSQYKGMTLDGIEIDPEGLGMFLIFNVFAIIGGQRKPSEWL